MTRFKKVFMPVLTAGLLLVAGCATSTIQSRTQERYAAYEALSPEMRSAVDAGNIKVGMSMDAVYIGGVRRSRYRVAKANLVKPPSGFTSEHTRK